MASGYVRFNYFATNLDELRDRCGEYGEAAVASARWGAVRSWLMGLGPQPSGLSYPTSAALRAVKIAGDEDLRRLNMPRLGDAKGTGAFDDLSLDDRCEAMRIAMATLEDWEREGSPNLSAQVCKHTQQFIHSIVPPKASTTTIQEIAG